MKALAILAALFALFLALPAQAVIVGVDFNENGGIENQAGFNAFNRDSSGVSTPTSETYSTPVGDLTVTILEGSGFGYTGNFVTSSFTNSGAFTYANLLNDFAYNEFGGSALGFELSGPAIQSSSTYTITVWAVDGNGTNDANPITISPISGSGTSGTPGSISYATVTAPTSNFDYSTTVSFTSNASGLIDFQALGAGPTSERVNGFEITLPEPASMGLLLLCLTPAMIRRRRAA